MKKKEYRNEKAFIKYLIKWLLLIFAGFALVSILFNVFTYIKEKKYYSEIIETEQQDRINYLSRNINEEFTKLKVMASITVKEDMVLDLSCKYDWVNSFEISKMIDGIQKRCMEIDNLNPFVTSSTLYLPNKKLKIDSHGYEMVNKENAYSFVKANKKNRLLSVIDGKVFIVEILNKNYLVNNWRRDNILGVFVIELNTNLIQKEMQFAKMMDKDILFITSPKEDEIYFVSGEGNLHAMEKIDKKGRVKLEGKEYQIIHSHDKGKFIKLFYLQDQSFLHLIRQKTQMNISLFIGILILTILMAVVLFYRFIFRPLEVLLVDAFGQIKQSNFSYRIPLSEKNSVFINLYQNFNSMTERIETLISRELKQEILVNQANFKHLQAQINPHFMYNSYFMLYRMIKSGDREGSLLICENLGKFFKYINRDSAENKSLEDEISHARSYAIIQGYRFQEIIHIDFPELPERYNYIEIPRLIVQPLIENVFKYVINEIDAEEKIELKVSYFEEEEHLIVCVENSGNMEEEQLTELREKLYHISEKDDITALVNINYRLDVLFNQERSLEIYRSSLGGLEVHLRLKM